MKLNLEKSLIDKYPDLLEEITEISHEDGWYQIIDELLEKIDAYLTDYPNVDKVKFVQIKEKFGGLRTYAYGGDDLTHRMIRDAEEKSRITCEICSSTIAKIRTNENRGWLMCRCDNCWNYQNRN